MAEGCVFCEIAARVARAEIVWEDEDTVAFVDLRQANPGHTLVIPRRHIPDLRELDAETGARLIETIIRITRAVDVAFPSDGMSLWHSAGRGAYQEVPHLHLHVHPRTLGDGLLRVYPGPLEQAGWGLSFGRGRENPAVRMRRVEAPSRR